MSHLKPRYLFDCMEDVRTQLKRANRLALFLDLDGTLVSIAPTPDMVRLKPHTRTALEALVKDPGNRLTIISGRAIDDLRRIVKLDDVIYAGNHGLEITGSGLEFVHTEAMKRSALIAKLCRTLTSRLRPIKGVIVECKVLSASIHYRLAAADEYNRLRAMVNEAVSPFAEQIHITEGSRVLELRPTLAWNKGSAVRWILNEIRHDQAAAIYVGDDRTDEDAFAVLPNAITIHVGTQFSRSAARFFVRSPDGVLTFLQSLTAVRDSSTRGTTPLMLRAGKGD